MKKLIAICCLTLMSGAVPAGTGNRLDEWDLGFVAGGDTSLDGADRLRVLGPFFERREMEDGCDFLAFRPVYSSIDDPARERSVSDFLWPLCSVKRFRGETDWHFFPAFGHDFDSMDPDSRWRTWILPILYAGRDAGGDGYFAVFPLGGTVHEFLGMDRIQFFIFPFFSHSTVKDLNTWDFLWPVFSRTKGEGVSRFRVFPFYGRSVKEGVFAKHFVLWPLWTSSSYRSDKVSGFNFILFPLFGRFNMSNQKTWMVLPPFFRYGSGGDETLLHCPWPVVRYRSGKINQLYFWPLWGKKRAGDVKSWFFLWPVVSRDRSFRHDETISRFRILPVFHYESRRSYADRQTAGPDGELEESGGGTEVTARSVTVWPLVSYRREQDTSQLRVPDLWLLRRVPSVERNLAPLWTLFSCTHSGDDMELEILWGLFRKQRSGGGYSHLSFFPLFSASKSSAGDGGRELSFLFGLVRYEREGLLRRMRLLYFLKIPFGNKSGSE